LVAASVDATSFGCNPARCIGQLTISKSRLPPGLSAFVEESLYHIAGEALNNALKHAVATSVTVRIHAADDRIELEVLDNGIGFDPEMAKDGGGLGLVGIRERVEKLGGALTISLAVSKGTCVRAVIGNRPSF
jgi:signal transduction histidine kinase